MFSTICTQKRSAIYGVMCSSQIAPNQVNASNATAFMIAPGILATVSHVVHIENDISKPIHQNFEVISSIDIGQQTERATLIGNDDTQDIALLRIEKPRNSILFNLLQQQVPSGTTCGSLGFPLSKVEFTPQGKLFHLVERFQGANISAFYINSINGTNVPKYEIDALMYDGSSGCPIFNIDGDVIGMQHASVSDPSQQKSWVNRIAISLIIPSFEILKFAISKGISFSQTATPQQPSR